MSPEAKKDLVKKNHAAIARMAARREIRRLRQNKKKVPPELLERAGWVKGRQQPDPKAVAKAVVKDVQAGRTGIQRVDRRASMKDLKAKVKELCPKIKGLADAKRSELERILAKPKEAGIVVELQETWAKRADARHEAWLKGDSASAKAMRDRRSPRKIANVA